ncbi:uncharacterized protein BXZ73DRAFT_105080 [Epithele typhae]|uniref:uncharacterized protein n=1 Tax=Epithele typhae TaxID=378194 RepID=UPI002007A4D9|nr:uncharacterized protein BXZ73DRAFT_105080 [Epithele typhae]KAH9918925.1 hypothetical protein BXZ73DRAFT_105080 [Epithele typhae]
MGSAETRAVGTAAALKELAFKKRALDADCTLRNQEIDMLDDAGTRRKSGLGGEDRRHSTILQVSEQIYEIEREMWVLKNARKGDTTAAAATVAVLARRDCQVELQLTHVRDAKDAKVQWAKGADGKNAEKDGLYELACGAPAGKVCELRMPAGVRWQDTQGVEIHLLPWHFVLSLAALLDYDVPLEELAIKLQIEFV